jgi:alpha-N-arabinofuranosidase
LQDYNSFTDPDKIKPEPFKGAALKGDNISITLPPASVVVLSLN